MHQRMSRANKATTVSRSMIAVGALFLVLAALHVHEDLLGAEPSTLTHLVPFAVLLYAVYEYRKMLREATLSSES